MEKLEIYNQVPKQIKFKPTLRLLLSVLQKSKKIREEFENPKFLFKKFLEENQSKFGFTKDWENHISGSTYKGQMNKEEIIRDGIGKSIDIYGNYLVGKFSKDKFEAGLVLNTFGCYTTNYKNLENGWENKFKEYDYFNGYACDYLIYDSMDLSSFSVYKGGVKNGLPHGMGVIVSKEGVPFYQDIKWVRITGCFVKGKANGRVMVDLRTNDFLDLEERFDFDHVRGDIHLEAEMKNGKFVRLIKSKLFNRVYHHNCAFKDISCHKVLVKDKIFGRFLYSGLVDFVRFIGKGRFRNIYYDSYENRSKEKDNVCIGQSAYHFPYDGNFIQVDWENPNHLRNGDNQFGFTRQYIESIGIMIEGNCLRMNNSFISCVKTRILTRSGGSYIKFERGNDFLKCSNELKEKSRFKKIFNGEEEEFIVNHYLNDTMTAYEELQFVKISSDGDDDDETKCQKTKAICTSDRLYYEGDVLIDKSDKRIIFHGNCTYYDYEYLAKFEGVMTRDSFEAGVYTTPYCILGDKNTPYFFNAKFEKGDAKFFFTGGYQIEAYFVKKLAQGRGRLVGSLDEIEGEWVDNVLMPDRKYVVIKEADPNQINKTCLMELKKGRFPDLSDFASDGDSDPEFWLEDVVIYTTILRQRIYNCSKVKLKIGKSSKIISAVHMEGNQISLKVNPEVMKSDRDKGDEKIRFTKDLTSITYRNSERELITHGKFNSQDPFYKPNRFYFDFSKGLRIEAFIYDINVECYSVKIHLNKNSKCFDNFQSNRTLKKIQRFLEVENVDDIGVKYVCYSRYDIRILLFNKRKIEYFDERKTLFRAKGIMYHHNGDTSKGIIENGLLNGHGKRRYRQTQPFLVKIKGNWDNDIIKNTHTFAAYRNGAEYRGEMKFNKRSGRGIMRFRNGEEYNGEWFCGVKHGSGSYRWKDGSTYEGDYKINMMWGSGRLTLTCGTVLDGKFWKNEFIEGKVYCSEGRLLNTVDN